jgi:hypothetical protein
LSTGSVNGGKEKEEIRQEEKQEIKITSGKSLLLEFFCNDSTFGLTPLLSVKLQENVLTFFRACLGKTVAFVHIMNAPAKDANL